MTAIQLPYQFLAANRCEFFRSIVRVEGDQEKLVTGVQDKEGPAAFRKAVIGAIEATGLPFVLYDNNRQPARIVTAETAEQAL